MSNGKLQVVTAVLKQQKPFKASIITMETDLSRQLVYSHLQTLVAEGFLEKDGMKYGIVARNDLLDTVIDLGSNNVMGKLEKIPELFEKSTLDDINYKIEASVIIRSAGTLGYVETRLGYQKEIDDLISDLKKFRRYLNAKTYSKAYALQRIEKEREAIWKVISKYAPVTRAEWDEHTLELEK